MNYLQVVFPDTSSEPSRYAFEGLSFAGFMEKIKSDFQFKTGKIFYIDEEDEQVELQDEDEFNYIKNQMRKKENVVKVIIKSEKKSPKKQIKQAILMHDKQKHKIGFSPSTKLSDFYKNCEKATGKLHISLKYEEDGEYMNLERNDEESWEDVCNSPHSQIKFKWEFQKVPSEKYIVFSCYPNREEKIYINQSTSFSDIKEMVYDKFNKENFYFKYTSEKDSQIFEIREEDEWEDFKTDSYNMEKVTIHNENSEKQKKVKIVFSSTETWYNIREEQPLHHFCLTFVDRKIQKLNYEIKYVLKEEKKKKKTIENEENWSIFMKKLFSNEVEQMIITEGSGNLKKNQFKASSISQVSQEELPVKVFEPIEDKKEVEKQEKQEKKEQDDQERKEQKKEKKNFVKNEKKQFLSDYNKYNSDQEYEEQVPPKFEQKKKKHLQDDNCPTCSEKRRKILCYYCHRCNQYIPKEEQEQKSEEIISQLKNLIGMKERRQTSNRDLIGQVLNMLTGGN